MFPYLPQAKLAAQIVAGLGVSKIVTDIIKNNVVVTTTLQKVTVGTGSFVLGSMLVDQSAKHIEETAETVASWFEKRNNETTTEK
jgi:hypothetical protein